MHADAKGVIIIINIKKNEKKARAPPVDRSSGKVRLQALEIGQKNTFFFFLVFELTSVCYTVYAILK